MQAITIRQPGNEPMELSINEIKAQIQKIQEVMRQVMQNGEHFGVIPGTNKPTLLKAGAEKLCLTFRLDPQYDSTERCDGDHLTVKSKCSLFHIVTGRRIGSGEGSCSTKESKYAYRRTPTGKITNDNLADQWNTVLKMANKRALVAAVLNATAASDIFTQEDLEGMADSGQRFSQEPRQESKPKPAPPGAQPKRAEINHVAHLGAAIMDFVNNDKVAALDVLKELTGKDKLKELSETEAKAAQLLFEQKYLSAGIDERDPDDDAVES